MNKKKERLVWYQGAHLRNVHANRAGFASIFGLLGIIIWDYLGKDGRYRSGSHFTGFNGILHARGITPETLRSSLSGGTTGHDFSRWLPPDQISALAEFIRRGLIDYRGAERQMESSIGRRGRQLYERACVSCHGQDGNDIDFKDKDGVQGVGWLANDNPQETLHKIRWGHPGSDMPNAFVDFR